MSKPLKIFITYSHKDLVQNNELKTRLAVMEQAGKIEIWDDNKILPGDEWEKDISDNLAESDFLLYLVSAASLASDNCNKELAEALSTEIRVIPIILESCDWLNHQLSDFQALPDRGKPINKWEPESDGWQNVVAGIRKTVEEMQSQTDSSPGTSVEEIRPELAFQQGNVLMMLRQIDRAIERYSYAIELNLDFAKAYNNLSIAYWEKRKYNRTIENLDKAIALKPDYVIAYYNRGNTYRDIGNYDRAIEDFNTAIQLKPNFTEAYNNRGNIYHDIGNYDRAIKDFNKMIELNPNDAPAYNNRGFAYGAKGDYDRAIVDLNKAIELNPDYANPYNNRGAAYINKGDYDRGDCRLEQSDRTES